MYIDWEDHKLFFAVREVSDEVYNEFVGDTISVGGKLLGGFLYGFVILFVGALEFFFIPLEFLFSIKLGEKKIKSRYYEELEKKRIEEAKVEKFKNSYFWDTGESISDEEAIVLMNESKEKEVSPTPEKESNQLMKEFRKIKQMMKGEDK